LEPASSSQEATAMLAMQASSALLLPCNNVPTLHWHTCDAITEHGGIASLSLHHQWRQLVLKPLSKLSETAVRRALLLSKRLMSVAMTNDVRVILHHLAEARSLKAVRLRIFLTSRPEVPIRYGFYHTPDTEHQDFVLHGTSSSIVDRDIFLLLEYNLSVIRQECCLDAGWPGEQVIRQLVQNASGLLNHLSLYP
jgi:hypothetical protein